MIPFGICVDIMIPNLTIIRWSHSSSRCWLNHREKVYGILVNYDNLRLNLIKWVAAWSEASSSWMEPVGQAGISLRASDSLRNIAYLESPKYLMIMLHAHKPSVSSKFTWFSPLLGEGWPVGLVGLGFSSGCRNKGNSEALRAMG